MIFNTAERMDRALSYRHQSARMSAIAPLFRRERRQRSFRNSDRDPNRTSASEAATVYVGTYFGRHHMAPNSSFCFRADEVIG
jgi:hypothetical protein